jgi:hypothetical protein
VRETANLSRRGFWALFVASLLFSAARFTAFLLHNLIPGNGDIASLLCSRAVNVRGKRQSDLLFLNLDPI